jgi:hypothetical protein
MPKNIRIVEKSVISLTKWSENYFLLKIHYENNSFYLSKKDSLIFRSLIKKKKLLPIVDRIVSVDYSRSWTECPYKRKIGDLTTVDKPCDSPILLGMDYCSKPIHSETCEYFVDQNKHSHLIYCCFEDQQFNID